MSQRGYVPPADVEGEPERFAVYRVYDRDSHPLYYGSSVNPYARLATHAATPEGKRWVYDVARVEVDWYATRPEAIHAEWVATTRDAPWYCVLGVTKPWQEPRPPLAAPDISPYVRKAIEALWEANGGTAGLTLDDIARKTVALTPKRYQRGVYHRVPAALERMQSYSDVRAIDDRRTSPPTELYIPAW